MLQLLNVAPGLFSVLCSWGWENAQRLEDKELQKKAFPSEGEPGCKILLQISNVHHLEAYWIGVLFRLWKMTGILCENWVQMWDWVSHITQILSCLHIRFHLQTISNFQITLFLFGWRSGQILLAPCWWEGTLFWKEGLCWTCSVPEIESGGWSRAHPSFCVRCSSLHPWGYITGDLYMCTWGWAEDHQVPQALWCALPGCMCYEWKDEAKSRFLKTGCFVDVFWVRFCVQRLGEGADIYQQSIILIHWMLSYSSMPDAEYIFVVCNE